MENIYKSGTDYMVVRDFEGRAMAFFFGACDEGVRETKAPRTYKTEANAAKAFERDHGKSRHIGTSDDWKGRLLCAADALSERTDNWELHIERKDDAQDMGTTEVRSFATMAEALAAYDEAILRDIECHEARKSVWHNIPSNGSKFGASFVMLCSETFRNWAL